MIQWNGLDILETPEELVDPHHTALLMWDFAENVVGNTFNAKSLVASSERLLQAARARNVLTIYTHQNAMNLVGDTGAPTMRMRMRRHNKPVSDILKLAPPVGWSPVPRLIESVKPRAEDVVFEKFAPNAFLGTPFEWWLKRYEIKTIVLAGVNVATGISGTAREAINHGYYAVVVRDCVGTGSKEDYDIALASMARLFDIFDADEIVSIWNRSPAREIRR